MRRSSTCIIREIEDQIIVHLRKCCSIKDLNKIHAQILVSFLSQSSFLSTQIINICNVNGRINYAYQVFNQVLNPNIFLYNAMIKACTQNLRFLEAVDFYRQSLRHSKSGDRFTYPFVLKACAGLLHHQLGKQIHLRTIISGLNSNPFVSNSLIEMYAKVEDLNHAHKVLDEMPLKDPVTWNTLISTHSRLGQMKKAMAIFNSMPNRTLISWTAIISGYSMAGCYSEAVETFRRMQIEGFKPDEVSIVSVLAATCDFELGKWIQAYSQKHGFLQKTIVCNALIEMYCRFGCINQALQIFRKTPERDVISWSTMVLGLAMNGRGEEAVKLFVEMEEEGRVRPNGVTFLGLLTGCAHTGLVQQGLKYFSSMKEIYGVEPGVEHYGCIVDLLSRSGCIRLATEFIDNMPISPDAAIWGSLLSACRVHGNLEVAAMVMEELVRLEPNDLGNYVLLSNIYAGEKRWEDVGKMRRLMRSRRLKKEPGCSSIEVDHGVEEFMAGDERHLRNVEMADMLQVLAMAAGKYGDLSGLEEEEEDTGSLELSSSSSLRGLLSLCLWFCAIIFRIIHFPATGTPAAPSTESSTYSKSKLGVKPSIHALQNPILVAKSISFLLIFLHIAVSEAKGIRRMTKENSSPNLSYDLSKRTVIFGLHLWVIVGICVGAAFVLLLFLISLWLASRRSSSSSKPSIPTLSKEILEVAVVPSDPKPLAQILQKPCSESNRSPVSIEKQALLLSREEESPAGINRIHIEIGKDHRITYPECGSGENRSGDQLVSIVAPEVSHLGWGHWFTLRELEVATNMFTDENVIGEGGYGIVYHGVLTDNTHIAVKNLLNNRGQAEREFKVEVEAIGRVRHKNLVRLLGYCAEGAHRMLVYEYVDNGNLEQWLHGDVGPISPLTWEIRMEIILGTAKGLMYLHEGLEPKVVHRDVKSSNILLDKQWNPKVSDFGLAKLLGSERSYVTTRVMGTFGYVAPEYASTGMLNERSDVYSFGILIMEIITGRNPVDYSRPQGEVNLVDWLKMMVSSRKSEGVLDPKMAEKPSSRALKRALLVALRCVDPDAQKRPKMGHVIHMLEVDDFPYRDDRRGARVCRDPQEKAVLLEDSVTESSDAGKFQSTSPVDKPQ